MKKRWDEETVRHDTHSENNFLSRRKSNKNPALKFKLHQLKQQRNAHQGVLLRIDFALPWSSQQQNRHGEIRNTHFASFAPLAGWWISTGVATGFPNFHAAKLQSKRGGGKMKNGKRKEKANKRSFVFDKAQKFIPAELPTERASW